MNPAAPPNQPPPDALGPTPSPNVSADTPPPDLGSNIPVKTQSAPPSPPQPPSTPAADDDLDKVMQDVGHQLKKEDREKSKKKRRSFFGGKPKDQPEAKLHAQPLAPITNQPPQSAPQARAPLPQPPAQPNPAKDSSAPVLVITLTIIVTGILIIAAFFAYKK